MYALRDVTSTVTSLPLQTSSIMSKKIAERPDSLVLDVKFGRGSFNEHVEDSLELAKRMIQTGELCGIRTTALVTRMDDPLGCSVGNWLEVKECIDLMTEGFDPDGLSKDLVDVTLALTGQMLVQGGKAETLSQGIDAARGNLVNGKAWAKFKQMVAAQGGDVACIESPEKYPRAKFSVSDTGTLGILGLIVLGPQYTFQTPDPHLGDDCTSFAGKGVITSYCLHPIDRLDGNWFDWSNAWSRSEECG